MKKLLFLFIACVCIGLIACTVENSSPIETSVPASSFSSKFAQEWMQTAYKAVRNQRVFALEASRVYAYTAVALYQSMLHGMPNHRSPEGQLEGLNNLPQPDRTLEYNWALVMNMCAAEVLEKIFTSASVSTQNIIWNFAQQQREEIIRTYNVSEDLEKASIIYGRTLATAIIQWAEEDRSQTIGSLPYTMPGVHDHPEYYDGNGSGDPFFMMPFWWTSRPFAISSHRVCLPDPPYPYSEDPNSAYYKDVLEVYESVKDPAKLLIGQYWANNPGESGTPAGSWVGIANQLVDQFKLNMAETLGMYVYLTLSTRNAFIAVWYTKYKWNLQRPVSFIRKVMNDPLWLSPVPTPPYPDYVSGTSANAGSSSEILTSLFGPRSFSDNQHADKNFQLRKYSNFKQAGVEAYHSRIYAGVHMRKACTEGFSLGECVAREVMDKVKLVR